MNTSAHAMAQLSRGSRKARGSKFFRSQLALSGQDERTFRAAFAPPFFS